MNFKLQAIANLLNKFSKGIPVYGKDVRVITCPQDFFSVLLAKTECSKKIILTSLYLGNGNLENSLVNALYNRARKCKTDNVSFDLHVLLDGNRGLRGTINSCTMLSKIKQDFSSMVNIALYQTPHLRPWMKWLMRGRLNETIGLQHMKFYMFDNSVIISGANLSNDYFVNRQDRYFVFENSPVLCDYIEQLVKTVSSFSLVLQSDGSLGLDPAWDLHPSKCSATRFCQAAAREMYRNGLCRPAAMNSDLFMPRTSLVTRLLSYMRRRFKMDGFIYQPVSIQESIWPPDSEVEEAQSGPAADAESGRDTIIYPLVGMGPLGIHADSRATAALLASAGEARVCLATGYFNLTRAYQSLLLRRRSPGSPVPQGSSVSPGSPGSQGSAVSPGSQGSSVSPGSPGSQGSAVPAGSQGSSVSPGSQGYFVSPGIPGSPGSSVLPGSQGSSVSPGSPGSHGSSVSPESSGSPGVPGSQGSPGVHILVASPKANGFFGGGGAAGYIPSTYVHLTKQFFTRIKTSGSGAIQIMEYFRPGWTFHAKGLWLYEPGSSLPSVSLIGSSNFGYRSVSRDLEFQVAILTTNKRLQEDMHEEKCSLFSRSSVVTDGTFQREECQIPFWVRFVMPVLKFYF